METVVQRLPFTRRARLTVRRAALSLKPFSLSALSRTLWTTECSDGCIHVCNLHYTTDPHIRSNGPTAHQDFPEESHVHSVAARSNSRNQHLGKHLKTSRVLSHQNTQQERCTLLPGVQDISMIERIHFSHSFLIAVPRKQSWSRIAFNSFRKAIEG